MRQKVIAVILAATVIFGACALPAGAAAAKPHRLKQEASISAQINLRGTHGFRVDLFSVGQGVVLNVTKLKSAAGMTNVSYFSLDRRQTFDGSRIKVKVGRLGHFRGRFVPTKTETKNLIPGCKGNPTTIETGLFVGSFDFRGERGYTVVHSHRARGTVQRQAAGTCRPSKEFPWRESARESKEQKERERHELHLLAGDERANVLFQARREEGTKQFESEGTTFQASVNGKRFGDFAVSYGTVLFDAEEGNAAAFQVPNLAEPLAEATIAPGAPFTGSATFHLDDPKTASWTGDLAVEMPGLGEVPLTGGDISAGLCHGPSCTKTLPKNLQPVLESSGNVIVTVSTSKPRRVR
ncbi:MAG: hypothetical protein JST59_06665 [Actinobacteria bacterium]|nr:hypothetical protein [Actinomycetota bacterium]